MNSNNKKITTEEAGNKLNEAFEQMDAYKAKGLESAAMIQNVKANLKQREAKRLEKKYGVNSPQTLKAYAKARYSKTANIGIVQQAEMTTINTPPFEANAWRFQGKVVDTQNRGLGGLTVSLFDEKGNWVRALGQACTDEKGFFAITYKQENPNEEANAESSTQPLIPTVSDNTQAVLHQEKEPVFLKIGRIDNRLIILGEDKCTTPPDNLPDNDNDDNNDNDDVPDTENEEKEWIVKGVVKDKRTKEALSGMTISLFDKDLLHDDFLGTTTTDENGMFELKYQEKDFKDLFEKKPDIYLKVINKEGTTLYTSRKKIRFAANKKESFNVNISKKGKS